MRELLKHYPKNISVISIICDDVSIYFSDISCLLSRSIVEDKIHLTTNYCYLVTVFFLAFRHLWLSCCCYLVAVVAAWLLLLLLSLGCCCCRLSAAASASIALLLCWRSLLYRWCYLRHAYRAASHRRGAEIQAHRLIAWSLTTTRIAVYIQATFFFLKKKISDLVTIMFYLWYIRQKT